MATSYFLLPTFYCFFVRQRYDFQFSVFSFRFLLVLINLLVAEIDAGEGEEAGDTVADGELCRNVQPAGQP